MTSVLQTTISSTIVAEELTRTAEHVKARHTKRQWIIKSERSVSERNSGIQMDMCQATGVMALVRVLEIDGLDLRRYSSTEERRPISLSTWRCWIDKNADNNWERVYTFTDSGQSSFGGDGGRCGGKKNQVLTWSGPFATFRWDTDGVRFKKFSVREIKEDGDFTSTTAWRRNTTTPGGGPPPPGAKILSCVLYILPQQ